MKNNPRIYEPHIAKVGETMYLSERSGQHVGVVLRKVNGDKLTLFSGENAEYQVLIESVSRKKVLIRILSKESVSRESPLDLHLVQAVLRKDKMDFLIQKATELGIKSIWPIFTTRTNVGIEPAKLEKKRDQWEAIAISACEQCGRNEIPMIHLPMTLDVCLKAHQKMDKCVLSPEGSAPFRSIALKNDSIALFIGPEGGFSHEETMLLLAEGAQDVRLGPRILRTETAGLTAISILQALFGDL